ncbi:hypothetical protein FE257_005512 [Aspergillus nanangensis]|uniref:Major facilitator superfamily (MFS) profile domain-containing protein n=1 Tax=Aspergillus nanangensis TaxID=2582783 RepID=A0AAD4GM44_ASPNN|nr:hypothetical protein FE257_005512 [Aspergillus nanangensis]
MLNHTRLHLNQFQILSHWLRSSYSYNRIAEKQIQTTKTTAMSPSDEAPITEPDRPDTREKGVTENNGTDANAAAVADPAPERAVWKLICLTIALLLSMFCVSLDGTILATAIPKITNQFDSLDDVGWYGSSYLFTTCAMQLMFGKFYTFFSTKWVFIIAVGIFEVGSLICGVAPNSIALIVGRSIAGIGAAGIFSGAIIAIAISVPLRHRPIYTAILSTMHGVSSVAGPLLGGVFTDKSTWRWCFYINLPMGAITILFTMIFMPPLPATQGDLPWKEQVKRLDLIGTFFLIPSVILVLLALQWGGSKYPWNDGRVIALLVVSGVLAIIFFAVQIWQKDRATIPMRLLKNRNILGAAWFGISLGASLFIFTYYLPIWFQAVKGVSATKSGIMNLPSILGLVIFSLVGGAIASWIGYYTPLLIASSAITAVGAGMLSTLEVNSSIGYWFGYQVLLAVGAGLGAQNVILVAQAAVPITDMAMATTLLTFTQTLSSAVFLSVGQSVFQNQLIVNLHQYAPSVDASAVIAGGVTAIRDNVSSKLLPSALAAYNDSIMQTFYVAVAMAALSLVGALCLDWISLKDSKPSLPQQDDVRLLSQLPECDHPLFKQVCEAEQDKYWVVTTTETIFYAQGGGQPYDTGVMDAIPAKGEGASGARFVVSAVRHGSHGQILHLGRFAGQGDETVAFTAGSLVHQVLNRERRELNSCIHTGGHLVGLAVHSLQLPGVKELKAQHYPELSFVDFRGTIASAHMEAIEARVNEFVQQALPVAVHWWTRQEVQDKCKAVPEGILLAPGDGDEEMVRVVDIEGAGAYPCGGTHVSNASHVGRVAVKKISRSKGCSKISYKVLV